MKVIIAIPCYNEAETLPAAFADLPRTLAGVDVVETLVVDDGSRDGTAEVARELGVTHLVRHKRNLGLAAAFRTAVDAALARGADVVVGTDADNQYAAADIPQLVAPLLAGEADLVVGCRDVASIPHFSLIKKMLQRLGSFVVRTLSGIKVSDATSGFRAYNREAAMRLVVLSKFTYTLETLIQAGYKGLTVAQVPVRVNAPTRPSRLFSSIPQYLRRSVNTILRAYLLFRPLRLLGIGAAVIFGAGLFLLGRWLYFYFTVAGPTGHVQSLLVGGVLILLGVQVLVIALLADLVAANRRLLEDVLYRIKEQQYGRR
ncbi:MAG: glycosyltransferase family 2 protein [Candidatus Coatesbacteria bacterium]|nr:MAG: glycosyltransferase family 2 protein [Candidatus Coatesbacteria bacterium]